MSFEALRHRLLVLEQQRAGESTEVIVNIGIGKPAAQFAAEILASEERMRVARAEGRRVVRIFIGPKPAARA